MLAKIKYFKDNYARPGCPDQRAAQDFVECENRETVRSFQAALNTIIAGGCNVESLDALVGRDRVARHGSYEEWARLMLIWISEQMRR